MLNNGDVPAAAAYALAGIYLNPKSPILEPEPTSAEDAPVAPGPLRRPSNPGEAR